MPAKKTCYNLPIGYSYPAVLAELINNKGTIWDSKKIISQASIQVPYAGPLLQASKKYYWKVMTWTNKNDSSIWSETAKWQMGLLHASDWKNAQWIALENMPDSLKRQPFNSEFVRTPLKDKLPLFRKDFFINKNIQSATAFITGLGHFELSTNGKKVGDHFLDAGWTDYNKEALYVTFDITNQIKERKQYYWCNAGQWILFYAG